MVIGAPLKGGGVPIRVWDPVMGEYKPSTIKSGLLTDKVKILDEAAGFERDLIDEVGHSLVRALAEDPDAALKHWRIDDVLGTVEGRAGRSAENIFGFDIADKLGPHVKATQATVEKIYSRLGLDGVDVGNVLDYMPRTVRGDIAEGLTREQTRKVLRGEAASIEKDILSDRMSSESLGATMSRTKSIAGIPSYMIEKMLKHIGVEGMRGSDKAKSLNYIREMLTKHEAGRGYQFSDYLKKAKITDDPDLLDLPKSPYSSIDDLAEELYKHSEHAGGYRGPMYRSDLMRGYENYIRAMTNREATTTATSYILARTIKEMGEGAYKPGDTKPLHEVLKSSGFSIHDGLPDANRWVPDVHIIKDSSGNRAGSLTKMAKLLDFKDSVGNNLAAASTDATKLDSFYKELAETQIPTEVTDQLEALFRVADPKSEWHSSVLNFIDRATAMFKGNVTLPFPAFASRNHVSGQVVNVSSGHMKNAKDLNTYRKAYFQFLKMRRNPEAWAEGKGKTILGVSWDEMKGMDLLGGKHRDAVDPITAVQSRRSVTSRYETPNLFSSWGAAGDYVHQVTRPLGQLFTGKVDPNVDPRWWAKTARQIHRAWLTEGSTWNSIVEGLNRAPMYAYLRNKGWSKSAALAEVNKLQFDYSALAPFEKAVGRRAMPFYAFTRFMGPLLFSTLAERPGGLAAQTIRARRVAGQGSETEVLPEYIKEQTAVPTAGLPGDFLEPEEEGAKSYITGSPLADEAIFPYLGGLHSAMRGDTLTTIRRGGTAGAGMLNPLAKMFIEPFTGSLHQPGRKIEDQNPTIAQTVQNIKRGGGFIPSWDTGQTKKPDPIFGMPLLEHAAMNSPFSRYFSTARMALDPRKSIMEKLVNLTTGVKTTTLSDYQQRKAEKDVLGKNFGESFASQYVDRIKLLEDLNNGIISEQEFKRHLYAASRLNQLARAGYKGSAQRKIDRISSFDTLPIS